MSYDLLVFTPPLPNTLREEWQAAIAKSGLLAEIHPDFDAANQSGYLAWKVQVESPEAFRHAALYPTKAVEAGFELTIQSSDVDLADWKTAAPDVVDRVEEAERMWVFSNPNGGRPADFRLLWYAAATLAELTDGVLQDPQQDRSFTGKAAVAEAGFQADQFEQDQRDDWTASIPFEAW